MKKLISIIFPLLILASSCGFNTNSNSNQPKQPEPMNKTGEFVNGWLANHPDVLNNDITKNKGAKDFEEGIMTATKSNPAYLSDITYVYRMMLPYNDGKRYAVKFEQETAKIHSDVKCEVSVLILAVMTEDEAAGLVQNGKYKLSWDSIDYITSKNFRLPSGSLVESKTFIYKDPVYGYPNVSLKNLVAKGLKYRPVQ